MATYLQGVTDYIPDYQPFQPDYNFYQNLLQTKQTQYDNNWKQLNNLYGQIYGAELTHDLNIKKKDELLKQIDFNLRRVSGLDLSLEQNVNQAMQVFRPFYEDKYLMKDMAYTKNWINTYNSANALKTSQDEKQRSQWWSTGIQGLELRRQMFKDATLDETLNIRNAQYTPFVNTFREYMDLAKKYNVSNTVESFLPGGMWMVKQKNGSVILPTLTEMFAAEYANRPDIQDMYREAAFVERMNYAYQNAEKFNGSTLEAEKEYIRGKMQWLKKNISTEYNKANDNLETTKNLQANLEKEVKKGNVNPFQPSYAKSLDELFSIQSDVKSNLQKTNDQLIDDQSTSTLQGYESDNDIEDIELARMKVDAGYAQIVAETDIFRAAKSYATANQSIEYKVNPVGLAGLKHQYKMREIDKIAKDKEYAKLVEDMLGLGYWHRDKETGQVITEPQANGFNLVTTRTGGPGQFSGGGEEGDINLTREQINEKYTNKVYGKALPTVDKIMGLINTGALNNSDNQKSFTTMELAFLVSAFKPNDPVAREILDTKGSTTKSYADIYNVWNSIYNTYKDPARRSQFGIDLVKTGRLTNVNKALNTYASRHTEGNPIAALYNEYNIANEMTTWDINIAALEASKEKEYQTIKNKLTSTISEWSNLAHKKDNRIPYDQKRIDAAVDLIMDTYLLNAKGRQNELNKLAMTLDPQITNILGYSLKQNVNKPAEWDMVNVFLPVTKIPEMISGREEELQDASWIRDFYDLTYEDLMKNNQLKPMIASHWTGDAADADKFGIGSETNSMAVHPAVYDDAGNITTRDALTRILKIPVNANGQWGTNITQYRITTGSTLKPSDFESDEDIVDANIAIAIAREYNAALTDKDKYDKLSSTSIESTTVAMENPDLGAITIFPDRKIIESIITKISSGDNMNSDKIDKIVQNGITFIAPNNVWEGNQLYDNSFPTAIDLAVENGPISYNDPRASGTLRIEKGIDQGKYQVKMTINQLMEDGTWKSIPVKEQLGFQHGAKFESNLLNATKHFNEVWKLNNQTYNKILESGNEEYIQKAQEGFINRANEPYWKY